jgi:hypothetical protein
LEGGALLTDAFVEFSKEYVLYCNIMSRVPGDKHQNLLMEKGGQGFPYIVFLDAEGNVLAKHEGARDADGFRETGRKVQAFLEVRRKAETGGAEAKLDYLIARLDLGHVKVADAEREIGGLGTPSPEQKARLDEALTNATVLETVREIQSDEGAEQAGKKFYEMHKAGKPAPTSDDAVQAYWILLMDCAEEKKDAAAFEAGFKALKAKFGELPQAQKWFKEKEETLKKLKESK